MIALIPMKEKSISQVLKSWRKRGKLSQQSGATHLQVSISTLQKWEQEKTTPGVIVQQFIKRMCK
jgi:DNA-binding transcriptional regulator YiaG